MGYYVNNEYMEEYDEDAGPPKPLDFQKVVRTILADKPRVTRFQINWGDATNDAEQTNAIEGGGQEINGDVVEEDDVMEMDDGEMEEEEEEEDIEEEGMMQEEEDLGEENMVSAE